MRPLTNLRITKIDIERASKVIHIGYGHRVGDVVRWSESALRLTLKHDGIELEQI